MTFCSRGYLNAHNVSDGQTFVRGQVLVGLELNGDAVALASLDRGGTQDSAAAVDGHAFAECNFGRHGEGEFNCGPFGNGTLRVKEHAATAQILREGRNGLSIKTNG